MAKDSVDNTTSENRDEFVEAIPVAGDGVEASEPIIENVSEESRGGERRELVRSASLVMLGNLGTSLLGMVRQVVVGPLGTAITGPFFAALTPAQRVYEILIYGSVSGALIPTFNDYAESEKRDELRRIVFTIVNLLLLITLISSIVFFFIAPWLVDNFLGAGFTEQGKSLTTQYARIIFFSLIALGPFPVLLATLYALKEFGWPALAAAFYHIGIIIGAFASMLLGQFVFGQYALAFGAILGTVGQVSLLMLGMRKLHFRYMFVLDLQHPALRRILKLYAPVAFSYVVTAGIATLDLYLATYTPCAPFMQGMQKCGEANYSAMQFATVLNQFPVGMVAAALSFAVLPTLTTYAREGNMERFKDTLLLGIRLGLLLMIPAAAGLMVLKFPIVATIFQHGKFRIEDAMNTALALQNYAYQLPFVAVDQLLIAAFYARKNTIIPVAIGVVSVLGYLFVALPLWQTLGMPALPLANAAQNSLHAVILLILLRRAIGSLHLRRLLPSFSKILVATALMVGVAWGLQLVLGQVQLFSLETFLGRLLTVVVVGGLAVVVYFGTIYALKVEEVNMLKGAVLAKLGKK